MSWNTYIDIAFGETFEPTVYELRDFADKLRPLSEGPPPPPVPAPSSPIGWMCRPGRW